MNPASRPAPARRTPAERLRDVRDVLATRLHQSMRRQQILRLPMSDAEAKALLAHLDRTLTIA